MKESENKYLTCDHCGKKDDTVSRGFDPYCNELYGDTELVNLCDECYHERAMDV